jgi:hypothetical protein
VRDYVERERNRENWWLHAENRPGLYHAVGLGHRFKRHPKNWNVTAPSLRQVIVKAKTSDTWGFAFLDAQMIFDQALTVITHEGTDMFAALQSTVHEIWARESGAGSKMKFIAQVLEAQFPDITETQPELVGHHYTTVGIAAQAIPYWQRAGERATARSACVEAIGHLIAGLDVLELLPDTPERTLQTLVLHIALGPPLVATKGYSAPEVERVCARARALCQHMGETPQLFPVLRSLGMFYLARADYRTAGELGEQLLTLAPRQPDAGLLLEAHFMFGTPLFYLGELTAAHAHLEQGIALYDLKQHRAHAALYGQYTGVACLGFAA